MWYTYTVEFYSAIKKTKILTFSGKYTVLEIVKTQHNLILLRGISQTQKDKYYMFSTIYGI